MNTPEHISKDMRLYIVEAPDHDYDTVASAVIVAESELDAQLQFRETEYAGKGRLIVIDITENLNKRGVLHVDVHNG